MSKIELLGDRAHEIATMQLTGKSLAQIAKKVGVSVPTLKNLTNSHGYQVEKEQQRAQLRNENIHQLESLASDAIKTLAELLYGAEEESVRLRAAKEILDRAGLSAGPQIQNNLTINQVNNDRTADLARALNLSHLVEK